LFLSMLEVLVLVYVGGTCSCLCWRYLFLSMLEVLVLVYSLKSVT
jgi:hypothetical protein